MSTRPRFGIFWTDLEDFGADLIAPPSRNEPYGVPQNPKEGRANMKSWLWKGMLAAAIALPALSGVARAQITDKDGCSDATLKADYAFALTNLTSLNSFLGITQFTRRLTLTPIDYPCTSLSTT